MIELLNIIFVAFNSCHSIYYVTRKFACTTENKCYFTVNSQSQTTLVSVTYVYCSMFSDYISTV